MIDSWMLKRRRYDGSETVIARYSIEQDAREDAEMLNAGYQSTQYYVEPFDAEKRGTFTNQDLINHVTAQILARAQALS